MFSADLDLEANLLARKAFALNINDKVMALCNMTPL